MKTGRPAKPHRFRQIRRHFFRGHSRTPAQPNDGANAWRVPVSRAERRESKAISRPFSLFLVDTDWRNRGAAARQRGLLGDPAAVDALLRALERTGDDGLRVLAIKSLAKIGNTAAVPALLQLVRHDPASGVRVTAVEALAQLGDPRGIDMLVDLVLEPAPNVIVTSERLQRPADGERLVANFTPTTDEEIARIRR